MRKTKDINMTEVLKVRHFVMNIVYRNGGRSVMIPSSRALSTDFGIARSTVQLSLQQMIREGYLIGRPGIGTFTNPQISFLSPDNKPAALVGLKVETGDHFYFGHTQWRMITALGMAITDNNYNLRHLNGVAATAENIVDEIRGAGLDGLILADVRDADCVRAAARETPTVNFGHALAVDGVNGVTYDYGEALERLFDELRREKRSNILILIDDCVMDQVRKAFFDEPEKLPLPGLRVTRLGSRDHAFYDNIRHELSHDTPDAIVLYGASAGALMGQLKELDIDPARRCRLVSIEEIPRRVDFRGWYLEAPRLEAAEKAGEVMDRMLKDKDPSVEHHVFKAKLKSTLEA